MFYIAGFKIMVLWYVTLCGLVGGTSVSEEPVTFVYTVEASLPAVFLEDGGSRFF
jgi:hypothetical protein